jgi:Protein of unknown function (DUF4058)
MASPFPGMDPYLEQPGFWSSFHTRFMVAIADALDGQLFPTYYVDVESRTYQEKERYLKVREVGSGEAIVVVELLSPRNKQAGLEHKTYLTHLVEIDLLRSNRPIPRDGGTTQDYHIIVSRSEYRPNADLYSFSIQDELPTIRVPLKGEDESIDLDLQAVFTALLGRTHYDARIDYGQPVPPPGLRSAPPRNEFQG